MNQLPKKKQTPSNQNIILIVGILMGIGIVVLATLVLFLFRQSRFQLSPLTAETQAIATLPLTSVAPTVIVPTACNSETFVLGSTTFQIQNLTPALDGSLTVPTDTASSVAYWLETAESTYLVVLSPTPENISLQTTLTEGNTATITWVDCSSKTFSLSAPEPNPVNVSTLSSQLTSGLTIFFETDTSGNGLIVRGELTEIIFP